MIFRRGKDAHLCHGYFAASGRTYYLLTLSIWFKFFMNKPKSSAGTQGWHTKATWSHFRRPYLETFDLSFLCLQVHSFYFNKIFDFSWQRKKRLKTWHWVFMQGKVIATSSKSRWKAKVINLPLLSRCNGSRMYMDLFLPLKVY